MSKDMQKLLEAARTLQEAWRSEANPDCTWCDGVGSVECHKFDCDEGVHACPKCVKGAGT